MNEREKLIEELENHFYTPYKPGAVISNMTVEGVVDWIIEDRKRIVAPLVKVNDKLEGYHNALDGYDDMTEAINETIKLAGVSNGE